jgi:hypothetical protein
MATPSFVSERSKPQATTRPLSEGCLIFAQMDQIDFTETIKIASWSIQNPPREWAKIRARWIRFHVIRTLVSVPAFAIYLLAGMSNNNRQ